MAAFDTVLVANRGEIAARVLRTARARGYRTVAVATPPDTGADSLRLADVVVELDDVQDYKRPEILVAAAQRAGAQAIHPGYGFLSENPVFAEAVRAAGLVFVGPPAEAIRLMGNKRAAKARMLEAGVPCIPGHDGGDQSLDALIAAAEQVGFPLMVKASAGGGGRGLRRVDRQADLRDLLERARAEASSTFGSGEVILERALDGARHVEVQVLADRHGQVVHLFERDCSVQRRHQKVIEEAPSPAVDPELRARMGAAAVRAAAAIGYESAGTVEMLLAPDGSFYFMEMNTRLQVEHPVTELVTGQDLVGLQLDVAAGLPLPFSQEDLQIEGHAIEARLYAEDPDRGFLPQTGTVLRWDPAVGPGVRVDHAVAEGRAVTADYDPMLAKIITHGRDREEARRRLVRALEGTVLHGVVSNQAFLVSVVGDPRFVGGDFDTGFLDAPLPEGPAHEPALALALALLAHADAPGGWGSSGAGHARQLLAQLGEDRILVEVGRSEAGIEIAGPWGPDATRRAARLERIVLTRPAPGRMEVEARVEGLVRRHPVTLCEGPDGARRRVDLTAPGGRTLTVERAVVDLDAAAGGDGAVLAPMGGAVVEVRVETGARVEPGQTLLVLEAMKMQLDVAAPRAGVVTLSVQSGQRVAARAALAHVEEESEG